MKFLLTLFSLIFIAPVQASGPLTTSKEGEPLHWKKGSTITYNPEAGGLKESGGYDQTKTLNLLKSSFEVWTSQPGVDLTVKQGPFLNNGNPVNGSNFESFLMQGKKECYPEVYPDAGNGCVSPIVWDTDGAILESMFGECSQFNIIGFAGMDTVGGYGLTQRGKAIFNGTCIEPAANKNGCKPCANLSDGQIRTVMVHELGHFLGLGHSQLNPIAFEQCLQGGGCPSQYQSALPTMFPMALNNAGMETLHEDDKAYLNRLYGDSSSTCQVSGTVFQSNGTSELAGVEVIAKNTNNALSEVIGFVSGSESPKNDQKVCVSNCGAYTIQGLKPNNTYQLCVQKINSQFQGISSIVSNAPSASQSISDTCPAGLTVQCQCPGGVCTNITGKNITVGQGQGTTPWGDTPSTNQSGVPTGGASGGGSSGGCSLIRY